MTPTVSLACTRYTYRWLCAHCVRGWLFKQVAGASGIPVVCLWDSLMLTEVCWGHLCG